VAHRIIRTEADFAEAVKLLGRLKRPLTLQWKQGGDRTLDQNHLQFLWAREAAEQRGDLTPEEVRCEWKLIYGVPIKREDEDFRATYDAAIKPLPYDRKLKAMTFFAVTSEMSVRQMVRYLDTVQRECAEQGIRLTDPDPELAKYQARYRRELAA
jgi:hypothetical protein